MSWLSLLSDIAGFQPQCLLFWFPAANNLRRDHNNRTSENYVCTSLPTGSARIWFCIARIACTYEDRSAIHFRRQRPFLTIQPAEQLRGVQQGSFLHCGQSPFATDICFYLLSCFKLIFTTVGLTPANSIAGTTAAIFSIYCF